MGIQVLADRVAILPMGDPGVIGSIIVPEIAKGRSVQGIVAFVGPDCHTLKRGMHVFFPAFNGQVALIGDNRYIIMYEKDVNCILASNVESIPGLYMKTADGYEEATKDFVLDMLQLGQENVEIILGNRKEFVK